MAMPAFSPTPSASHAFPHPYYAQQGYYPSQMDMSHMIMTPGAHQIAQGRMALPHHGMHPNIVNVNPHATPSPLMDEDFGPSPFLPEEEGNSPFGHPLELPPVNDTSPMMMQIHMISPTEYLELGRYEFQRPQTTPAPHHPHPQHRQQRPGRPPMPQRHTMHIPPRPAQLHRQASLQPPARSASPHVMAGDVFDLMPGSPIKRPSSSLGLIDHHAGPSNHKQEMVYHFVPDMGYYQNAQGISPARALGPAPMQPQHFSPQHDDQMITPHVNKAGYASHVHSSGTTSTITSGSSSVTESGSSSLSSVDQANGHPTDPSDEENESPTRGPSATRAMSKMQLNERGPATSGPIKTMPPPAPAIVSRPSRPPPKPVVTGGRTSAKFAKVAEDPGVEGVPPGQRSADRPGPSFACIIGQAILKCSAGGLSLEHIYRYVETAYPYFKTGDGAWRNSVRHNLSIHKMFETIPRTEKFPPGKGGIWIIHDDEKCHWPEENKFIKNFPSTHPHHAACRQSLHERAKEREAMDKAAREGRVYVPKKGKKGRKLPTKDDEEDAPEMTRSSSSMSDGPTFQRPHPPPPPAFVPEPSYTPKIQAKIVHPPPFVPLEINLEGDGEFLPMDEQPVPIETSPVDIPLSQEDKLARFGAMVPPRFERKRKVHHEEDNVFTSTKRVRVAEPMPHSHEYFDDSFITPERERPVTSSKTTWSAFKTPALVNTSSSPGSSPMPTTITRTTHHPSALQQAWTHDDMARSANCDSPPQAMLDSAFDFQPKSKPAMRSRTISAEDDFLPSIASSSPRPPKTPVTRSSAAVDKTPRFHHARTPLTKTPLLFGSPALPPPSANAMLSTPLWDIGGCLDRLRNSGSPIRSPMPPTSPTRYAMLLDSGASPRKMMREFSI